jgi:NADH-quinone oxidoreductase subunit G
MPDVNVTIDGTTVSVPAGTNVVDAARKAGVAIPVFCYHPKMKPVGMCRMCLIEVYTPMIDRATNQPVLDENGKPKLALMLNKLQPGCTTPVSEGMVVNTVSDKVQFAQKGVLEFLLTSHPLDCPVCDKGGECPLQNLTMQWGPSVSRFDYEDKIHFQKPIPLGDLIYLDRERCILCSRCVRFEDEIADDNVLGFDNRGRKWEIISKSEVPFDSKFSGNTTDICPVGALTSADFRFKARVWELKSHPSVCPHCPVGCDISVDMRYNELKRVMPRENDFVNEIWICDKGRYGMRFFEQEDRLTSPLIKRNGQFVKATWDEAFQLIADKFGAIRSSAGADALAGLAGPRLPNEDLYLFQKLFREALGTNNIDHRPGTAYDLPIDDLPRQFGVGKGTNLMTLGKGTAVLVIGADPEEEAPLYQLRLRGIAQRGGDLTVVNSYATKLERSATRKLRPKAGSEAQFVMALINVILEEKLQNDEFITTRARLGDEFRRTMGKYSLSQLVQATGLPEDVIRATARAFAQAENAIVVYGRMAANMATLSALATLAVVTGKTGKANNGLIALRPGGNFRGALDMGVCPDASFSGTSLSTPGLSTREMWSAAVEGRVRGMYISAMNPARENPAVVQALEALEFLVVQDLFLTETAQHADVILPAAAFSEREGTFTNAERRVQRFRQARPAPADLPADWQIFQSVAQALGVAAPEPVVTTAASAKKGAKARGQSTTTTAVAVAPRARGWNYILVSDVADEIVQRVPGYNGMSYTGLSMSRASWGRQPNEAIYYDGTSYENTEGVGIQVITQAEDGKRIFAVGLREPALQPVDDDHPLTLLTPTRAYDGGEWMRGSKLQARRVPPHIILSVADAERLGVSIGETVVVTSTAGSIGLPAQIDAGLSEGLVLIPDVRGAQLPSLVTGPRTRVSVRKAE